MLTGLLYHRRCGSAIIAGAIWLAIPVTAALRIAPAVANYYLNTNPVNSNVTVVCNLLTGRAEVVVFAPDAVRVRYHWDNPLWSKEEEAIATPMDDWPFTPCAVIETNGVLELRTSQVLVQLVLTSKFQVHFKTLGGAVLNNDFHTEYDTEYSALADTKYTESAIRNGETPDGFKLKNVRVMPAREAYFGAGDHAGPLNRRGQTIQCWNADFYDWGEYQNPKYMSLPFFYGVQPSEGGEPARSYGIFFNNENRAVFKFWSGLGDTYSFEAGDGQMDYFFFGGGSNHQMQAVLDRYTELTGRPCMLPRWFFGFHQSRWSYWNQNWIEWLAAEFRAQRFPCDAIHMDIDYMWHNNSYYQQLWFNTDRFPNPHSMITNCLARGVRIVPLIEPYLNTSDPLYSEANGLFHFVKHNDQSTFVNSTYFGPLSWLDFSSTNCVQWWQGYLTNFLQQYPFEAVWNDLNEPADAMNTPRDALYWCDGRYPLTSDSRRWHLANKNVIANRETRCTEGALRAVRPGQRPAILSRAAWPGIQRTAANWSGDNHASWEHCRHNIRCGLSVMISGQANYGHDIGGFVGDNNAELYTRWLAWGALNPFCRVHSNGNGAQEPSINEREPWRFGSPYTEWNRRFIEFRYQLMPTLYSLAYQSTQSGAGMNTPAVFHFADDTNTYSQNDYDLMIGDALLAAPVYSEGTRSRSVYLPGTVCWTHTAYDDCYPGGTTISVPASMGTLPLFAREGAILPSGPVMQHAHEFVPDYLDIHVWPGSNRPGVFMLYEDDGLTTNYTADGYALTRLSCNATPTSMVLMAGARQGSYDPGARSLYYLAHRAPRPVAVALNGARLPRFGDEHLLRAAGPTGWCFNTASSRLAVKAPNLLHAQTVTVQYLDMADSDSDGMPDWWEDAHTLDAHNSADAADDPDGDGSTNLAEWQAGSDPRWHDAFASPYAHMASPGTFNLWDEAARNARLVSNHTWACILALGPETNQLKLAANDAWSDDWGDNSQATITIPFTDTAEKVPGANNIRVVAPATGNYTVVFNDESYQYTIAAAAAMDSDHDGLVDEWELTNGLNPFAHADRWHDEEGDGIPNHEEYTGGTSPLAYDNYAPYFAPALTNCSVQYTQAFAYDMAIADRNEGLLPGSVSNAPGAASWSYAGGTNRLAWAGESVAPGMYTVTVYCTDHGIPPLSTNATTVINVVPECGSIMALLVLTALARHGRPRSRTRRAERE